MTTTYQVEVLYLEPRYRRIDVEADSPEQARAMALALEQTAMDFWDESRADPETPGRVVASILEGDSGGYDTLEEILADTNERFRSVGKMEIPPLDKGLIVDPIEHGEEAEHTERDAALIMRDDLQAFVRQWDDGEESGEDIMPEIAKTLAYAERVLGK